MVSKRKYEDEREKSHHQPPVHASRQFQVPNSPDLRHRKSTWATQAPNARKPRSSKQPESQAERPEGSVNALKKCIRDITRRLERVADLPADIRAEDERALDEYERQLAAAEARNARKKIVGRYKMVRFFESQKAGRAVKKLKKRLSDAESPEVIEQLTAQLHGATVDLNYTQYSPLCDPYIGIFAKDGFPEDEPRPKQPMWAEVEKAMKEGTYALEQLRDRKPLQLQSRPKLKPKPQPKPKKEPEPAGVDTSGMNRWQRRQALGITETKKEKAALSVKRTQLYANTEQRVERPADEMEDDEDGSAFFIET